MEWVYPDGTKSVQPLLSVLKSLKHNSSQTEFDHCFYKGNVDGEAGSIGRDLRRIRFMKNIYLQLP